ncbi:hypothetical protein L6452_08407 [Arctium lappa]|uniref:Uncharacterized protein n=1 Tax=Arctium lappa TaxID=4217 RepID=A0ACB9DI83_ARCLA|nr:hypothetical protein L6452_08407 [Arctium lappa]
MGTAVVSPLTWDAFKKEVLKEYCREMALDRIEEEFRALKKGDMSVIEYFNLFMEKLDLVGHVVPSEKDRVKAYMNGLPARMKAMVRNSKASTLWKRTSGVHPKSVMIMAITGRLSIVGNRSGVKGAESSMQVGATPTTCHASSVECWVTLTMIVPSRALSVLCVKRRTMSRGTALVPGSEKVREADTVCLVWNNMPVTTGKGRSKLNDLRVGIGIPRLGPSLDGFVARAIHRVALNLCFNLEF